MVSFLGEQPGRGVLLLFCYLGQCCSVYFFSGISGKIYFRQSQAEVSLSAKFGADFFVGDKLNNFVKVGFG